MQPCRCQSSVSFSIVAGVEAMYGVASTLLCMQEGERNRMQRLHQHSLRFLSPCPLSDMPYRLLLMIATPSGPWGAYDRGLDYPRGGGAGPLSTPTGQARATSSATSSFPSVTHQPSTLPHGIPRSTCSLALLSEPPLCYEAPLPLRRPNSLLRWARVPSQTSRSTYTLRMLVLKVLVATDSPPS